MKFENRLIAFFDVLGFAKLLETKDIYELHKLYKKFIQEIKSEVFQSQATMEGSQEEVVVNFDKSIVFSDSVILISKEITNIKNINSFILSCISLMDKSTKNDFPLRGAIGKGDFIYDDEDDIFLSYDFAKIYKFEGQQEWCGCSILEDTQDLVKNAMFGTTEIKNKQSLPILKYNVPLKKKKSCFNFLFKTKALTKELMCLNFYYMQTKNEHQSLLEYLKEDNPKQVHTKEFFDFIEMLEDDSQILTEDFYPAVKLKTFKTRTSVRIKFEDKNGNGVDPKIQFTLAFFDDGNAKASSSQ